MTILDKREAFTPFEYPKAYEFWQQQQSADWKPWDIKYGEDVSDWATMPESHKRIVGGVLRGFTQTELLVNEYWSTYVKSWFPKPEIALMCSCFASMEGIHAVSYNQLSETLGLDTYSEFKSDPAAQAKLGYLLDIDSTNPTLHQKARSLAIFSAFTEGVSLFSSFAILQYFSTKNQLKGVGDVIKYSILDEGKHSEAGIWLYRQLLSEYPVVDTIELRTEVEEGARAVVQLEHSFIDSVFSSGGIEGLEAEDIKAFISVRANIKLRELGYDDLFDYNRQAADNILSWFNILNIGADRTDFFATLPTYATIEVPEIDWDF